MRVGSINSRAFPRVNASSAPTIDALPSYLYAESVYIIYGPFSKLYDEISASQMHIIFIVERLSAVVV